MSSTTSNRPFGVTVLAILAGIACFLAFLHFLQSMAVLPYFFGPIAVLGFNLWAAIMWILMVWVWFWLTQMLWNMEPQAWVFLVVITTFNLILDFTYLIGRAEWNDIGLNFIVNALILVYCILPNVRRSFGQA